MPQGIIYTKNKNMPHAEKPKASSRERSRKGFSSTFEGCREAEGFEPREMPKASRVRPRGGLSSKIWLFFGDLWSGCRALYLYYIFAVGGDIEHKKNKKKPNGTPLKISHFFFLYFTSSFHYNFFFPLRINTTLHSYIGSPSSIYWR